MTAYAIGLDIGIASVGWAVVGLDKDEKPYTILGMGSRIFPVAEETDSRKPPSLAANRREKRGTRRRLRRQRHRNERIRELMLRSGLVTDEELNHLFEGRLSDVYALRVDALDRPLTNTEFARILIHISQRRGFRSNRKGGTNEKDGLMLTATKANADRMVSAGYRTVAEMLLKDEAFKEHKRNKSGEYLTTVTRAMIEDEVDRIFEAQRKFGNGNASEEFQNAYKDILLSQRSYAFGPGGDSPYGGNQVEKMRGKCTFFPDEPRAAKGTYSFQYFELLQKINHIRLTEIGEKEGKPLSDSERKQLVELAKQVKKLTYAGIRENLGIPESKAFSGIHYDKKNAEENEKFNCMANWHEIRTALKKAGLNINDLSVEQLDAIGEAFSINDTSENIRVKLEAAGVPDNVIETLDSAGINFSKFGHLSLKAIRMIIPWLEKGLVYRKACEAAGFNPDGHDKGERTDTLHPTPEDYENITSPVVKRAVSQTIKVLNAIIRKQGCPPTYVKIELQREMAKTREERRQLENENKENQKKNDELYKEINEKYGIANPSGQDVIKLKLYEQQGGVSAYSLAKIDKKKLFEHHYVEIDHIIPYSRSFDDRMSNKVLVFAKENQDKGNRLPLEYIPVSSQGEFRAWAEKQPHAKKVNLLCESYTKDDEDRFIERNLQDTKHMSRFLMNYIKDNLKFAPIDEDDEEKKKEKEMRRVVAVNGSVTAYLRKRWNFSKNRADGDLHHAVDALVIVCTTQKMINELSDYFKWHETKYRTTESGRIVDKRTGEIKFDIPLPWLHFREEAECFKQTCFVSRMPNHKVTGPAHKDTIRSAKVSEDDVVVKHVPLKELKLDKKTGEINGYYRPDLDRALYDGLKARLMEFAGDGIKAFAEPFCKPNNPERIVRRVRLVEKKKKLESQIRGGWAENDTMVRVDVFCKDGMYWMVPIYVRDTLKPELPNKAVTRAKPYEKWVEMEEKDFVFSLYPNDLFFAVSKEEFKLEKKFKESKLPDEIKANESFLYYVNLDIANDQIGCVTHDNSYKKKGLAVKSLERFEKYTVDVLGEYHKVEKETRQRFNRKED